MTKLRYLPIQLDVRSAPALVVGAHDDVVPKIERLLEAGARVRVVAPAAVSPAIDALAQAGRIALERRAATDADLDGAFVVFISVREEATGVRLAERARAQGRLVCTLDRPELSTFTNAALARAHHLVIAVATGGTSPGLSRRIREELERLFGDPRFGEFVRALRELRASVARGERAARMSEAVRGFAIRGALVFPEWFEQRTRR